MKIKTLNKLLKDYAKIFENLGFELNEDFKKDYLHIKRMKANSTKISFIKADKIEGLKENIKGFTIKPNCQEQREKYFQAVKPSKFLDNMLLKHNKPTLFREIAEQFNKDFIYNLKSKLELFSGKDICEQYSINASIVGCMSGMSAYWFNVYRDTEGLQLATLKDEGNTMLIRALLWHDKQNNSYWLDNSYEQSAINGDEEVRQDYQKKLIVQVLEHLKADKWATNCKNNYGFGCSFAYKLKDEVIEEIEKEYNLKIYNKVQRKIQTQTINTRNGNNKVEVKEEETQDSKNTLTLSPKIKDFDYYNYEAFPYSDTFQSIGRTYGKWHLSDNSGDTNYVSCRSTEGEDENDSGTICECCDERIQEDEIHYSEIEAEYLCDECCTYIDEREDSCRSDNAVYNNYTGCYIYRFDIE